MFTASIEMILRVTAVDMGLEVVETEKRMGANRTLGERRRNELWWERDRLRHDGWFAGPLAFFVGFRSVFCAFSILSSLHWGRFLIFRSVDELRLDPVGMRSAGWLNRDRKTYEKTFAFDLVVINQLIRYLILTQLKQGQPRFIAKETLDDKPRGIRWSIAPFYKAWYNSDPSLESPWRNPRQ